MADISKISPDAGTTEYNVKDATARSDIASVEEVIGDMRAEQAVLGAKNLLEYPYINTTKTENGITFTDNGDGTVTVNGTATAATKFYLMDTIQFREIFNRLGAVILNGCPSSGEDYRIITQTSDGYKVDNGNGILLDKVVTDAISIEIKSGVTVSNLVFKPMLRLASDPDDTYQPYAMTNLELTKQYDQIDGELIFNNSIDPSAINYQELFKIGRFVICKFKLTGVTLTSWGSIASIPEAFRPFDSMVAETFLPAIISTNVKFFNIANEITNGSDAASNVNVRFYGMWITS